MKRLSAILVAIVMIASFVGGWQGRAAAHELETDNGVSAVLHVEPDDNPKSGEDTVLYFAFDSEDPAFNVSFCKCLVSFQSTSNRLEINRIAPLQDSSNEGTATVHFDAPGVYDIAVRGQTGTDAAHTFQLAYKVRVAAGTDAASEGARRTAGLQVVLLSLTSLVITGVVASGMVRRGSHYAKSRRR